MGLAAAMICCCACSHTQAHIAADSAVAAGVYSQSGAIRAVWRRPLASARACFRSLFAGTPSAGCMSWSGQQRSGALPDGDVLYVGSWDRHLRKVAVRSGRIVQSVRLPARVSATPQKHDNSLLVGLENGMLLCLHKQTLQPIWQKPQQLDADIAQQPVIWADRAYVVTGDSSLYAIAINNGDILWRKQRPLENLVMMSQSRPLILPASSIQRSMMLIGNRDGKIDVYDAADGNLMFQLPVSQQDNLLRDVVAGPIAAGHLMVAASVDGTMRAWRQAGFEEDWSLEEPGLTHLAYDAINNRVIAAGAGQIIAVATDSGQIHWRFQLDKGAASNLVIRSGHIYTADTAGGLFVLNAATGKMVQWLVSRSRVTASVHSSDAGLYVVSETGVLYGFTTIADVENSLLQDVSRGFIAADGYSHN